MNRQVTLFSKLGPPDVENSEIKVHVVAVQTQGFAYPHSCHRQQSEKSRKRTGPEPLGRGKLLGPAKEPFDLLVAIDMRQLAAVAMREEAGGWNLGARFERAKPDGEASNHAQAPSPGGRVRLRWLCGPAKCQFGGDVRGTRDL